MVRSEVILIVLVPKSYSVISSDTEKLMNALYMTVLEKETKVRVMHNIDVPSFYHDGPSSGVIWKRRPICRGHFKR